MRWRISCAQILDMKIVSSNLTDAGQPAVGWVSLPVRIGVGLTRGDKVTSILTFDVIKSRQRRRGRVTCLPSVLRQKRHSLLSPRVRVRPLLLRKRATRARRNLPEGRKKKSKCRELRTQKRKGKGIKIVPPRSQNERASNSFPPSLIAGLG